ncbi:22860_t:CDS:2 [Cetraspora pellucida]|uniref:22860_t:CDS:1 n=1 Tax=Cetraspora pellucida TaxID=1433469 RepID=A0A9N9H425_9GLOM|nr:22860_t:CDS:2 [Cetraspora pellucida]
MAARGGVNSKGEVAPQPVKVQRYWPGKVPEGIHDYSSEEEEEEPFEREPEIITTIEKVDITEKEAASDRRLRRLKEAKEDGSSEVIDRRRRHFKEEDQDVRDLQLRHVKVEQDAEVKIEEEEDDLALRRKRLRDRVLEQRKQEEEQLKAMEEAEKAQSTQTEEEESEGEETSEYETDSEEEQASRKLLKPVFIPRHEKLEEEAEAKRLQELEERKKESHLMVAEVIQKELQKTVKEETGVSEVDDTDGLDEQAEYEAWKLRELKRIKRDKEEREAREKEQEEIERRRNMSEEQRLSEDMERVRAQREKKPHGQYKFLQKYYHKDEKIFKRDYTEATPDEAVMQVKNFGRAGQTKWTHLADQDTSKKDAVWSQNTGINKSMLSKLGGLHGGFDKPTSKRRRTK